ncbi:MAG TPA: helix-turn-helix domain-containing protein [Saprospiraceae bacterium]|nr:helix-turn-helix domain-containing protein [Saprospiraceae bacterium]
MINISILVPDSAVIQAIADPQYLFSAANQFMQSAGKEPLFNVKLVGLKEDVQINHGMFSIKTDHLLKDVVKSDLVIIPALYGNIQNALEDNHETKEWIIKQYENGADIASLCVGAFLLASTGLLDGRKCSTHWGFQNEFREMFPNVELVDGSIITEEKGLYSSGGANSYWNLLLHLLEKYSGREIAILASKYFAIDIDRDTQNAFAMFKGQKNHNDAEILKAQEYIETNNQDKISVDELAELVSVGRRSFERRFKIATNNSALEYIHRIKIEAAKRSFESSRKNITEVMFDVGYTDTKSFRNTFKKITGLTPIEYRNKYNKLGG